MPRGQPDYGMYSQKTVGATLADMGELAVRLGSIVNYDKRGDVVDFDDFESPVLKWGENVALPASYIRHDSFSVRSGGQALKIHTDAVIDEEKHALRTIPVSGAKRVGFEASSSYLTLTGIFAIRIRYYTGARLKQAELRYNAPLHILEIYNDGGGYTTIAAGITYLQVRHLFYSMKIVVDFDTDTYIRALFADREYDLSAYSSYDTGSLVVRRFTQELSLISTTAAVCDVYADAAILTQAEP